MTSAASSIYSTPRDMARYVAALVGDGVGEHGAILKPETLAMMFRAHYQPDPRIPGMGLAFFRVDLGGHAVVEHQGVLPGFNSQIFLAPDDGVGVLAFTNGSRNAAAWLTAETQRLLGDLIGASTAVIRTDVPPHPEIWGDLCGWYRPRAQRTDLQAWSVLGAGVAGPRPARAAPAANPEPDTRPVPGCGAAPGRSGRPVRLPDRSVPVRHGPDQDRVQP